MNTKTRNIIGWVLSGLIAAFLLFSASMKFMADAKGLADAAGMGLNADEYYIIAVLEIISVILFLIPRTGVLGTMLLAAYLGGAIATHMEHNEIAGQPTVAVIMEIVLFIAAAIRFPELTRRLMGNNG
jgi:hypothetical protein